MKTTIITRRLTKLCRYLFTSLAVPAMVASLLLGTQTVYADAGQVTVEDGCMQDLVDFSLVCTANDVKLARADNIKILDDDGGCQYPGDTVEFEAEFVVELNSKARHDIGIYFEVVEDAINDDGALTGICSVSSLNYKDDPPWLDLNGTFDDYAGTKTESGVQDTCGDIDADHNPLRPTFRIIAECIDKDGDGFLDLPYCTSWKQPGDNELCTGPLAEEIGSSGYFSSGVGPGAPSKCNCDPGFSVEILVPPASIQVVKTATTNLIDPETNKPYDPPALNEPGGPVTFDIYITNDAIGPQNALDLTSCRDDVFGELFDPSNEMLKNTCNDEDFDDYLEPGNTSSCYFIAEVTGNVSDSPHVDVVTCLGTNQAPDPSTVTGSDDAIVAILNVDPSISVLKEVTPDSRPEPGGDFSFTVTVTNTSTVEDVSLNSLIDSIYGDLTAATASTCILPQTLTKSGGWYSCGFTGNFTGLPGDTETDTVTASATDDELNVATDTDDAKVEITNVGSSISCTKGANPDHVDEPRGDVTYTLTVTNESPTDVVTIETLNDNIYGDITDESNVLISSTDCTVTKKLVANGGAFSCSFTAPVSGNGNDTVTDKITASGNDDDGEIVSNVCSATVMIDDVAPTASLTKTVTKMVVTYEVQVFNKSTAEAVFVDELDDDEFGDLNGKGTCVLAEEGEEIAIGESYTCSFTEVVTTSPHTNTVTGTLSDDEGNYVYPKDSATVEGSGLPAPTTP